MSRSHVALSGLLLIGTICCAAVYAQQPAQNLAGPAQGGGSYFVPSSGSAGQFYTSVAGGAQDAQLAREYVKSEKEEEKRDLRKKLADLVGKQFDQHSQQQQKELEDLEKEVARLKTLLRKRIESRSTIVDRRLEQLIQEAEGLGWNAPSGFRSGFGRAGATGAFGGGGFSGLAQPAPAAK